MLKLRIFLTCARHEAKRIHRRDMGGNALPAFSRILGNKQRSRGAAHGKRFSFGVDGQPVAINQVVVVLLRKTTGQGFEALISVSGPVSHQRTVYGYASLVFNLRHEPAPAQRIVEHLSQRLA